MDSRKQLLSLNKENNVYSLKCMFHALARDQVYPGQPAVLGIIADCGSLTQGELAKSLGVSGASMAVSVKRLERGGLIRREPDKKDRRVKRISLTPRGAEVLAGAVASEDRLSSYCLRDFSDAELAQMGQWLRRINDNLKDYYGLLQREEAERQERNS